MALPQVASLAALWAPFKGWRTWIWHSLQNGGAAGRIVAKPWRFESYVPNQKVGKNPFQKMIHKRNMPSTWTSSSVQWNCHGHLMSAYSFSCLLTHFLIQARVASQKRLSWHISSSDPWNFIIKEWGLQKKSCITSFWPPYAFATCLQQTHSGYWAILNTDTCRTHQDPLRIILASFDILLTWLAVNKNESFL